MNKITATVLAKTLSLESVNPRAWACLLMAGGALLIYSGLREPCRTPRTASPVAGSQQPADS